VSRSGDVHTHALPNYSFTSAIDLARQLIDSFPAQYGPATDRPDPHDGHDHGGHDHGGHDHGGHDHGEVR